jgi:hypothetical protein
LPASKVESENLEYSRSQVHHYTKTANPRQTRTPVKERKGKRKREIKVKVKIKLR